MGVENDTRDMWPRVATLCSQGARDGLFPGLHEIALITPSMGAGDPGDEERTARCASWRLAQAQAQLYQVGDFTRRLSKKPSQMARRLGMPCPSDNRGPPAIPRCLLSLSVCLTCPGRS